jgi:hypothetical protein
LIEVKPFSKIAESSASRRRDAGLDTSGAAGQKTASLIEKETMPFWPSFIQALK